MRVALLLMLQCGLRVGEVARLEAGDIDRRERAIIVRGKGGDGRVTGRLPVPIEAWEAISTYLVAEQIHAGPLLRSRRPGEEGRGITGHYLSKLVRLAMREAGIKAFAHDGRSAHALRHTTAQDLIDAGVETRVVQKALRHSTIQSTEIYLRGEVRHLREAMEGRRYLFPQALDAEPEAAAVVGGV